MMHEERIEELQQIAGQLGITLRYEKGDFEGGYCILKEERILLINKRLAPNRKASVLALGLQQIGLDNVYLKPVLRAYIEDETARNRKTSEL